MNESPRHYREQAQAYFDATCDVDMAALYQRFVPHLTPGARLLDAGCGSGRDALAFSRMGFVVDAFDASPELAALASTHTGLDVKTLTFSQVSWQNRYQGIWACASLLHVAPSDQTDAWQRLLQALSPGGLVYASYKLGEGESVDAQGRPFTHATAERLVGWLPTAPLSHVLQVWHTNDQRPGVQQAWLNVLVQRSSAHDPHSGSSSSH